MLRLIQFVVPFMLLSALVLSAQASSIQKIGVQELSVSAELVFEGEVIYSRAQWNEPRTRIYTYVRYRIDEIVLGNYTAPELTLRFAGGVVGPDQMLVEGMIYPRMGERGIYFVESLSRPQVNPLVGWSQGHYKIENGRMRSNQDRPVVSVESEFKKTIGEISEGAPGGMVLGNEASEGLEKAEFKALIKSMPER